MNLNPLIIGILQEATNLDVAQDEYDGDENTYIVFTYINENPDLYADNMPTADVAYLQIQLICPKSFNYFKLKKIIRDTLEKNEFTVESIRSFLGDRFTGTEKIRQTIFEVHYSESRR